MTVHRTRPAETAGAAAGTGAVVAAVLAHNWLAVGLACVGYVPGAVSLVIAHGGVRGILNLVWKGRR